MVRQDDKPMSAMDIFESQSDKLYLRRSNMSRVGEINPK